MGTKLDAERTCDLRAAGVHNCDGVGFDPAFAWGRCLSALRVSRRYAVGVSYGPMMRPAALFAPLAVWQLAHEPSFCAVAIAISALPIMTLAR